MWKLAKRSAFNYIKIMININGDGLSVIIRCEYVKHHDWLSFASWYSISKCLPDAEVAIYCKMTDAKNDIFAWPKKFKILFNLSENYKKLVSNSNTLIIDPWVIAVREYSDQLLGPVDVKSKEAATFVDYKDGCGNFVIEEWIHNIETPFRRTYELYADDMSVNEWKVLKMWEQVSGIYDEITR